MNQVNLTIDGKTLTAPQGEKLLWVALNKGIYIPNLCAIHESEVPFTACRLCFVEVVGEREPVTACTTPVKDGMVVRTRGEHALRLARTSAELLLSTHPVECGECSKNRSCELLKITRHLGMKLKTTRFRKLERNLPVDESSSLFIYNPDKCVLCGRCVWVCRNSLGIGAISFTRRGFKRRVSTFEDRPIAESACRQCGECAKVCPVGALAFKGASP